jgi:Fic family protein
MEGTKLNEDQTQQIFDEGSVFADGEPVVVDDVFETRNHFRLFDALLDYVDTPLTTDVIKQTHALLKRGTAQECQEKYNVGGFKKHDNQIGLFDSLGTTPAAEVESAIAKLFEDWESSMDRSLTAFAKFHWAFESIHPFSDGNGRIGRLLLFKELLRAQKTPIIIRDEHRASYISWFERIQRYIGLFD